MYLKKLIIALLLFWIINPIMGQAISNLSGLKFEDSLKKVQKEILVVSDSIKIYENENPNFPLAKTSESHLIAYNLKLKTGKIGKVIFTFSDDKLSNIEAIGNIEQALINDRKDVAKEFMGIKVYVKDLLFFDLLKDKAWILTREAAHVGLFTWDNPLQNKPHKLKTYNSSAKMPEFLKMGQSIKDVMSKFKMHAKVTQLDTLDGRDSNAQFQINAYGVEYAGFPRKFEARFGDNKLNKIWILTGKEEEYRIRKLLIESYGEPIFVNDDWEFFSDWNVGLRKDLPEVLFLNEEMSNFYKKIVNND